MPELNAFQADKRAMEIWDHLSQDLAFDDWKCIKAISAALRDKSPIDTEAEEEAASSYSDLIVALSSAAAFLDAENAATVPKLDRQALLLSLQKQCRESLVKAGAHKTGVYRPDIDQTQEIRPKMSNNWQWWTRNEHGYWCDVCGNLLAAPHQFGHGRQDKKDYAEYEPSACQQCGAPDEIDPEAI